jgi:ABC-type Na+ efflux pump permease subunit
MICAPAIIFLIFSLAHIVLDVAENQMTTATIRAVVMVVCTLLLDALCVRGQSMVAWVFVMVPFIIQASLIGFLVARFGLDTATGTLKGGTLHAEYSSPV